MFVGVNFWFRPKRSAITIKFLALFMACRKDTENAPADAKKKKQSANPALFKLKGAVIPAPPLHLWLKKPHCPKTKLQL